ncbi:nitrogen fixation protein NifB [Evansella caseinilytica]|uniref:FeMo cofactor biosynthesis protein NifB n=1 Tax=Evansella caseinilytica TaxID=1503961 RepID=A0A1H3IA11_9BACI|nr:nitrogenase cofactor biosynthesis protein NifB [Evansella caseinilytica]SDY24079.1 nitrogen fixation protein NifB [Evansella caseinilytica]
MQTSCTAKEQEMEERIARHPCFSEEAHHYFARMHVAVAPACNIQCNYCNRKFDCVNESRPGVVSEVLKPEEAVQKVLVVAGEILQMSVVGIAGPGDPLANPQKTFATFKGVAENAPDLKLCLSTNGLRLPEFVEQIAALEIDHVTITINAVNPAIGSRIYSWIFHQGKKYSGRKAAEILISQQLKGLEYLTKKGILVKVNSVLIPGVNDRHLEEVAAAVRQRGAFMHNIMPLIVAPDTEFSRNGVRNPTSEEIEVIRQKSSASLKVMKHCRQCRADAVGLLGEDRSAEFTKDKVMKMPMKYDQQARKAFQEKLDAKVGKRRNACQLMAEKHAEKLRAHETSAQSSKKTAAVAIRIAATTRGSAKVNLHFGHAKEFLIFDCSDSGIQFVGIRKVQSYCVGKLNCGSNKQPILAETSEVLKDCQILLCSGIGDVPKEYLLKKGIVTYVKSGDIEELLVESRKYYAYMNESQSALV